MTAPPTAPFQNKVTLRSLLLGLVLSAGLAALNCWITTVATVHYLGGVQMPFGSLFALLVLILAVQLPLQSVQKRMPGVRRLVPLFSAVELLTIYSMLVFAALVSTPGTFSMFLTTGPGLFYFSTLENGWADLFYRHVPSWFAPGWDGATYQRQVIDPLFLGKVNPVDIPWHAWFVMLTAWSVLLLLSFALLFFVALAFRKQWTEHEALSFPLLQVPMAMVEVDGPGAGHDQTPFWKNRGMWAGFALAAFIHMFKGMNAHYPDWPMFPLQDPVRMTFTEHPWSAVGNINAEFHLGGLGLAYLLPREISLSFWVFFLVQRFEPAFVTILGFPELVLQKDAYKGQPIFISYQSIGGWLAMAVILLWAARSNLWRLCCEAFSRETMSRNHSTEDEPYSPRFIVFGSVLTFAALVAWCNFAGISLWGTLLFLAIYLITSIVLTRIVIESGFLFIQMPFSPLELMTSSMLGNMAIGAGDLTRLTFLHSIWTRDARTTLMPSFLHTMKIAHELRLPRREQRRLFSGVAAAIVVALVITIWISVVVLYGNGTLTSYDFLHKGPVGIFTNTATMIKEQSPGVQPANLGWMAVGAAVVWLLTLGRSQFYWFPLHPAGYLLSSSTPMGRWWFSYFLGWLIKSLIMRFGGATVYQSVRPFMIGLILGNLASMVFWMLIGLRSGVVIKYWSA